MLALCSLVTACGADEATKVFGEQSEPCQPIELANEDEDEQKVATGTDCFMTEYEAGRSVVLDVLQLTVEGDPMPTRYEFDGSTVIITTDTTRDEFGSGGVLEQRCEGIGRTGWLPEGIDCQSSAGDGFLSDSLPGSWEAPVPDPSNAPS